MGKIKNKLKDILKIVNSSDIAELEWEENGEKILIRRSKPPVEGENNHQDVALKPMTEAEKTIVIQEKAKDLHIVKSCLVGTYYLVSPKDKKIIAKIGDKIKDGQKLCLVEAMKVFKEIKSDREGEIKEILVKNGQSVEYGQPLFKLLLP